jgi:ribosomal protein S18 acetylase RimI-like enzyme
MAAQDGALSSPGLITRYAGASDAGPLLGMMRQLAVFEGYDAAFAVTAGDLIERGLAPESPGQFAAIVAQAGEMYLGYAVLHEVAFTYDLRPTLVLKELYVADGRRGAGVGSALMTAAVAHARRRCGGLLRWAVLPDNERAKAFYRRFGGQPDGAWEHWVLDLAAT